MFGLSKQEKESKLIQQYNDETKELMIKINAFNERAAYYGGGSAGYDNADTLHNIYNDFGYPDKLEFINYWNMYRRFGPATAVVDTPPNLSWLRPPTLEATESLVNEFDALIKKTNLWNRLKGLDKRQRVGRYAGLFVEVSDGKRPNEEVEMLNGIAQIHNLKPIYEGQLRVSTTEQSITSPNYGQPTMYEFNPSGDGEKNEHNNSSHMIHPSRLIMAAEGADDGSIYGVSALENIYDDLMDLRKICGAGGEGFYQNTRNAPIINAVEGFSAPQTDAEKDKLEKEIDDFLSKWQKKFVSKGLEFNYPNIKLDDPKSFAENSWNNISAGSGIPSSELRGAQTGVLAGDKDNKATMVMIQSRRENFLNEMVTSVIDWFMAHGVLQTAPYEVIWEDMTSASDSEQWELNQKKAETFSKLIDSLGKPVGDEVDVMKILEFMGFEDIPVDVTAIDDKDIDELQDSDEVI